MILKITNLTFYEDEILVTIEADIIQTKHNHTCKQVKSMNKLTFSHSINCNLCHFQFTSFVTVFVHLLQIDHEKSLHAKQNHQWLNALNSIICKIKTRYVTNHQVSRYVLSTLVIKYGDFLAFSSTISIILSLSPNLFF